MARYCDGDASAFRELYALVAPRLLRVSREDGPPARAVAEDLLQQTFLKVHRARAAYVRGADPIPWIYAIAHRTFIDEVRKGKRAKVAVGDTDDLPEVAADLAGQTADRRRRAPRRSRAARGATLDALAELPEQQREAVVLTKLEGKSVAEAAEIAGTTSGAMKVRAHRGYEALRKLLGGKRSKASGTKEAS